jgi:hypothetical protein
VNRSIKAGVVGAALAIAVTGLAIRVRSRQTEPIPEPRRGAYREVFPDLDLRTAQPGSPVNRVYEGFGRRSPESSSSGRRCIFFTYDPDLFKGALVVLANGKLVDSRWVVRGTGEPTECSGLPHLTVDLRGWYAAAVR